MPQFESATKVRFFNEQSEVQITSRLSNVESKKLNLNLLQAYSKTLRNSDLNFS